MSDLSSIGIANFVPYYKNDSGIYNKGQSRRKYH